MAQPVNNEVTNTPMERAHAEALRSLPHGVEFRFVERVTALNPGVSAKGIYTVPSDAQFIKGHFPSTPLMPGVLMVEAGAQLAGIVAQTDPLEGKPDRRLRLTGLRAVKITGTVGPGAAIELEAHLVKRLGNLIQAHAQASCGGQMLMQADITLSLET